MNSRPIDWFRQALFGLAFFCSISSVIGQTNFAVLTSDGAWTWFNDPRALFNNGTLYFGYNRAADGKVVLSTLNLQSGLVTNLWASSLTQEDDHDVPGLLTRNDGTMLAIYSRHQSDQFFTYRLSSSTTPVTPSDWGAEQHNTSGTNVSTGMAYSNPYQLSSESGRIYNFARYINYNPNVFTSTDGGATWSTPQILIQTGTGSTRPYVKYCSDYNSRIDFLYTDAHPDNFTTSLYHMYYQGGSFFQTDGTFLKSFANLPILHDSGERGSVVYQYSDTPQSDPNQWIPTARAWCWEIGYQTNGNPVCVFQTKVDNVTGTLWSDARIYYYYATWTGTNWQKRFIAQAGRPLYNGQPDYGGGMCLDPQDPTTIYISTDAASPFDLTTTTNVPLGNNYQIWKGTTTDGGLTFTWRPITGNSTIDNLRPYIPRRFGGEPCVLWFRGTYISYTSFSTSIVGLFTTQVPQANSGSGTWDVDSNGLWSNNTNWLNGVIADGPGNTADFSTLNITGDRTVTLDTSRTIGSLRFGNPSGTQNWTVSSSGSVLTLSAGAPSIVVNQNIATLSVPLAGTNGFTKTGPGTLVLSANNSLSGTLNLDSGSTTANDGTVQITSSAALAGVASPINFRNNSGTNAVASLQLNGSNGGITVAQNFSTTCRNNNTPPTFESLAGTNTLAGTNFVQVGGTNVIYQSDAGSLLQITAPIQYVGSLTAARNFSFNGNGNIAVSGPILSSASNGAPIGVLKTGSGTLTLSGANTYTNGTFIASGTLNYNGSVNTGSVTVNAGSLAGIGTIGGPVTVAAAGTLSPGGNTIGTLTINNALTNKGTFVIRLNKSGSTITNDTIKGVSTLAFGGPLQLIPTGNQITVGDNFKIFYATAYRNSIGSILPTTPGTNLLWNTNNLTVNGTLSVSLGIVNPVVNGVSVSTTNIIVSGGGGAAGYGFTVLTSTNLAAPLSNWPLAGTGVCDSNGNFLFTNVLSTANSAQFYIIRIP
jgi:autotransporter-associated beta strand protein